MENPQADWILSIKEGDILLERGKKPRVVRTVSRHLKYGTWHTWVTFVIKRRSWTNRCYTVLNEHDLRMRRFIPTPMQRTSMSYIDKKINYNIVQNDKITLTAQQVIEASIF